MKGMLFDIEEFAVHDGPGIRIVVFLKGCALRCSWCHNPEGLEAFPQRMVSRELCRDCGRCREVCPSKESCTACGRCASVCPARAVRIAGYEMTAEALVKKIRPVLPLLKDSGGGITFSGGEPLLQPDFILSVCDLLPEAHMAIETSGYAPADTFQRVCRRMDLVLIDIKHTDPKVHLKYTGADNQRIMENLHWLTRQKIPFIARIPLIPGVNDTIENMEATAGILRGVQNLIRIELLPYNRAAGAKYNPSGRPFEPGFDENADCRDPRERFIQKGLECVML